MARRIWRPSVSNSRPAAVSLARWPRRVEQQHVKVFLKFLHGVGDGRRHAVKFLRRGGETAFAVDRVEYQQGIDGYSHDILILVYK